MKTISFDSMPELIQHLTGEIQQLKKLVVDLNGNPVSTPERMSIKECSELTGYTRNSIYQLVHQKRIPYHKPKNGGSRLIFLRSEIEEWLLATKPETANEYCDRKEAELSNRLNKR